jgi:hypothetical protein
VAALVRPVCCLSQLWTGQNLSFNEIVSVPHKSSQADLRPTPVSREDLAALPSSAPVELSYRVVDAADAWLETAYQLLSKQFDRSVLDTIDSFADFQKHDRQGMKYCPLLMVVAYVPRRDRAVVLGVVSGNLMPVRDYVGPNPAMPGQPHIYAVGHQVTAGPVRAAGFKGVGGQLWHAAMAEASTRIGRQDGTLCHCLAEAENESLGFWTKVGFRWPKGVIYWQPPLEFDAEGHYVLPEVPEVLMLRPMDAVPADSIDRVLLQNIIATVYLDWSLGKYRDVLSARAMQRAEEYVMRDLFGRVCCRMPPSDPLPMTRLVLPEGRSFHRRTMALAEGIQHQLEPLQPITLAEPTRKSKKETVTLSRARRQVLDLLYTLAGESDCRTVLAISGPLTLVKLSSIIAALVERGLIQAIVADSQTVEHGFCSEAGHAYFQAPRGKSDTWLYEHGYNRMGDVLATQFGLDELQDVLCFHVARQARDLPLGSADVVELLGRALSNSAT